MANQVHLKSIEGSSKYGLFLIDDRGIEHYIPYVKSCSMYIDVYESNPVLTLEIYQVDVDIKVPKEKVVEIPIYADGTPIKEENG